MMNPCKLRLLVCSLLAVISFSARADTTNSLPRFDDVYKVLREQSGMSPDQLDQELVRAVLAELRSKVSLVTNEAASAASQNSTNVLLKTKAFDKGFGYFRIGQVSGDIAEQLAKSYQNLAASNKLKGVVLDLRFAEGQDYAAAASTADLFLNSEQPLLDWGSDLVKSTLKKSPIGVPVAILVNRGTRGSAEALAAALRETHVGLLLGSTTAGQASLYKEFALPGGQQLRVAVAPVKAGKGQTIPGEGLKPDIQINIAADEERQYLEDAFKVVSRPITSSPLTVDTNSATATATNQPRGRLNEAELVRRHREGLNVDEEFVETTSSKVPDPELKLVSDPVLARALDLLKGLAVVQQARPL
jgi:C-terminal processing protease CtpA/Prc